MREIILLLIAALSLTNCRSDKNVRYEFWDISEFNIVDSALKDGEEIKVLYTSGAPDDNKKKEYFVHVIAISQRTGDTINILTALDNGFSENDIDKVFYFLDQNNIASRILQMDPEKLKDQGKLEGMEKIELKRITKIARDLNFDEIASNKYPTVIGTIGTVPE